MIISVILIFVFLLILADLFFLNYLWMNFNNELFNIFNVLLFALFLVFIVLDNLELKKFVRIKCDKEIFDNIETNRDKLYTITYRFGYFNNDYGNLGNIEEYKI